MSSKPMYVVLEADNLELGISIHGPCTTKEEARTFMREQYRSHRREYKLEERIIEDSKITATTYKILLQDGDILYGEIKEITVEEPDTEAERWITAVKDRMDAKTIPIPEDESEINHIAEEAQHYASKNEYFVGGFWDAIALAVQDYVDEKQENEDEGESKNDNTNSITKSV